MHTHICHEWLLLVAENMCLKKSVKRFGVLYAKDLDVDKLDLFLVNMHPVLGGW